MTAKEVRELPYLAWQNDWAWMERMRGKRWEQLLRQEREHYRRLLTPRVRTTAVTMKRELTEAQQCLYVGGFQAGSGQIDVMMTPEAQFCWKRSWHKRYKKAYDLDAHDGHVWYVTKTDRPYVNQLLCEDQKGHLLWHKTSVSSEIAVIPPYAYYIQVDGNMKANGLYACDALTGKNKRLLYKEKNEERYISLIKASGRTLYLESEDPSQTQTFRVDGLHVRTVFPPSAFQIPLGYIKGKDVALLRRRPHDPWMAYGAPLTEWQLPTKNHPELEITWANLTSGHVLTIHEGSETLWYCASGQPAEPLFRMKAGSFFYHAWEAWEQSPYQRFMIRTPTAEPFVLYAHQNRVLRGSSSPSRPLSSFKPLEVHKWHTSSADGTSVAYVVVHEKGQRPKTQMIYVYGAYGSTTPVQWPYSQWYPLLKRGWAIVYAYVRGGGDKDTAWADQARREWRHRSVDDLEAVIRSAQQRLGLHPAQTVVYGRSAGGVPVGSILARAPKGELVGAVFTEVPYVDVLRTSTNPDLPLTVGEYKEFGDPMRRLVDFHELLHVSPINSLPEEGAPGVFVLTRVGLEDKQVYAYESFKWIQRLRGHVSPDHASVSPTSPNQKFITYERNQEHVYRPEVFPHFRALDLAVLHAWAEGTLPLA